MVKTTASCLKAKFGQYMRTIKSTGEVLINDRDQPVARLVPYDNEENIENPTELFQPYDPAAPSLGKLVVICIKYNGTRITDLLIEDRARR